MPDEDSYKFGSVPLSDEYIARRKAYFLKSFEERRRLANLKGHEFTRKTYQKALRRATLRFQISLFSDSSRDERVRAATAVYLIQSRGRREKGMWT